MANAFEMDLWEYGARALAERAGLDPDELVYGTPSWRLYERDAQCVIDAIFDGRQEQRTPQSPDHSFAMDTDRNVEIRRMFKEGARVIDIAQKFGIGRARVYHIIGPVRDAN